MINRDEYVIDPLREGEEDKFSVVIVEPSLKDPRVYGYETQESERREIRESGYYSILNSGQSKFSVYCNSIEELHEVYVYLLKKGYRHTKIYEEKNRTMKDSWVELVERKHYTTNELCELLDLDEFPDCIFRMFNEIQLTVNLCKLPQFKRDIEELRDKLSYRNTWEIEGNSTRNNNHSKYRIG